MKFKAILLMMLLVGLDQYLPAQSNPGDSRKKTDWYTNARFGMFIHFGLYSIPARGEWVRSIEKITVEDYDKYFKEFNPYAYDAKAMAKLARQSGMKYAVMTAKHHEGFCLFDSKLTNYKSTNTPIKRDLIKEFVEAFRAEGLKVGIYYSTIDWYHPDYPAYGDNYHPMRDNLAFKDKKQDYNRYLDYMHGQVNELTTNYGKIDIMWFDFSYGTMTGEKWKAKELIQMIRKNQPDIILNNRLGGDGSTSIAEDKFPLGDFETPEQAIPEEGRFDKNGNPIAWETNITFNNSWGYTLSDQNWKSPELIIHSLVNCVSKNGNMMLNIGPDGTGRIPQQSIDILNEVGLWMNKNSKSIYNCKASVLAKPEWGRYTQNGKFIYAHLMYPYLGHINLKGYKDKIQKVRLLRDGSEAVTATEWWGSHEKNDFFININKPTYLNYTMPDAVDTVFEIELK